MLSEYLLRLATVEKSVQDSSGPHGSDLALSVSVSIDAKASDLPEPPPECRRLAFFVSGRVFHVRHEKVLLRNHSCWENREYI